mgnify:CR=1 FL=1
MNPTHIKVNAVNKIFKTADKEVVALRDINLEIPEGQFVCLLGPSGCGKSTLLNLIGALDHPSSGDLHVCATQISTLSRTEAAKFRGDNIGFIFQDFNLIPVLTVFENVEYPLLMVRNWPAEKRRERVMQVLAAVGMVEQAEKKPDQISGGQKQRVAVARALVGEPKLVLADEPTANLDHDTAYRIINLMKQMRDDFGTTFLFSTHDPKIMLEAEQTFVLEDGRLSVTGGAL